MADIGSQLQHVIEDLVGNEALLEMLQTDAATEMLNWGMAMATSLMKGTQGLEESIAELTLLPRLKAIRQTMRSIGNWAAGKYSDPESRVQLRDKLLGQFKVIFGEDARLPSADELDKLLNQVDEHTLTPQELILNLRAMLESYLRGGSHVQTP